MQEELATLRVEAEEREADVETLEAEVVRLREELARREAAGPMGPVGVVGPLGPAGQADPAVDPAVSELGDLEERRNLQTEDFYKSVSAVGRAVSVSSTDSMRVGRKRLFSCGSPFSRGAV